MVLLESYSKGLMQYFNMPVPPSVKMCYYTIHEKLYTLVNLVRMPLHTIHPSLMPSQDRVKFYSAFNSIHRKHFLLNLDLGPKLLFLVALDPPQTDVRVLWSGCKKHCSIIWKNIECWVNKNFKYFFPRISAITQPYYDQVSWRMRRVPKRQGNCPIFPCH